ncbi:hypothetical protein CGH02_19850 [Vibrio parahaemolyticus]|nr:hypothetical protein CGJ50_01855 [Vibrio parahaemolyticus]TOH96432.1 hypothetical protein CGI69_24505 [Vibrio parahaemolyticus]TOJ04394.1 hypothetical protein CGI48_09075 [Vibrio parahaemolyticus]TOJ40584.1 hypothetical protein CGI40_00575 [Vibrio parahaemolyticus]TOJ47501.1 hypothetical protein CGI39_03630 [Vibrio parahaemolyticus]
MAMDKLLASALEIKQRTMVTGLFAKNGFKIAMTDFDDVTFEREGVQVNVHFDMASNAESVSVLSKKPFSLT